MSPSNAQDRMWRERAARVIPGGMYGHESTLLLPDGYPQFFSRVEGAHLWDVDGNRYVDFMCAYGPNLLGYLHPEVEAAAAAQAKLGDVMTGPSPIMVELAEALTSMIGHADWAMFCKNGTDATTTAVTIARAHTGKRKILVATGAYHGAAPWCTPRPAGVLPEDRAHIIYYTYNDPESLAAAVKAADGDLAGIVASAFRHDSFHDEEALDGAYARACRAHCDAQGALLLVDEVRAGFRLARDCSWSAAGVDPDISCWGKLIANGHPISAVLGSDRAREAASSVFVTGSFWFAAVPMAAALKTLELIRTTNYLEKTQTLGRRLREGLQQQGAAHGFTLRQTGPAQMPQIMFEDDPDFRIGFAWTQEMLKQGAYMHPWHNMFLNAAMTEDDIRDTIGAADRAFEALRRRIGTLEPHPVVSMLLAAE